MLLVVYGVFTDDTAVLFRTDLVNGISADTRILTNSTKNLEGTATYGEQKTKFLMIYHPCDMRRSLFQVVPR